MQTCAIYWVSAANFVGILWFQKEAYEMISFKQTFVIAVSQKTAVGDKQNTKEMQGSLKTTQ